VWVFCHLLLILCDGESVESFAGWSRILPPLEALAVSDMQITCRLNYVTLREDYYSISMTVEVLAARID
jgi:hypothetical protein